jgi:hypothetical protein
MSRYDDILQRGKDIYNLYARESGFTYCNRSFADVSSKICPAYILVEERFTTGHDDSALFVELIDENECIIQSWMFDCPVKKLFSEPDYYENDCLVYYLVKEFNLPAVGYRAPE